jgi:hypothetical protein
MMVLWSLIRVRDRILQSFFGEGYIIYLMDVNPKTIEEPYLSLDIDLWKEAIQSEMGSNMANETLEVLDHPYKCKPMGCKWVVKG